MDAAVAEGKQRLQAIFDGTHEAILVADPVLRQVVDANAKACELFGYTRDEMLGKSVMELHPPDAQAEALAAFEAAANRGPVKRLTLPMLGKDGRRLIMDIRTQRLDVHHQPLLAGFFQDVTAHTQTEELLEFLAQRAWDASKEDFLTSLATFVGERLQVDYVLIDVLRDEKIAESVAFYARGAIVPNVSYELRGTPCENVAGKTLCHYKCDIQNLFPSDRLLVDMKAESYLGIPLWDAEGHALGLMVILDSKPLPNPEHATQLLMLASVRVCAEIQRRRQLEALQKSEARIRQLVEASPLPMLVTELPPSQRVLLMNQRFTSLFGYTADEVPDAPSWWPLAYPDPDYRAKVQAQWQHAIDAMLAKGVTAIDPVEAQVRCKDGRQVTILGHMTVLGNSTLVVFSDITERKQSELELRRYQTHLEAMVEARTVELLVAKDAAEAANRAKSTFLANMSHELRTPMHAIMGMLSLAIRRSADAVQVEQLGKARSATERLLGVINDILDLSKVEAECMTLENTPFRMREVLEHLLSLVGQRASEKGIQLAIKLAEGMPSRDLVGDPLRLGQVLLNLMGNALKFTEQGSVTLRGQVLEESDGRVLLRFEVEDTGIGLTTAEQARLFKAFSQADDSLTRKYGGTGLGLAISKRLVEMMGGQIGVDSTPGQGSRFWFTARLAVGTGAALSNSARTAGSAAEAQLRAAHPGARVLLAEDEPINQEVSRSMLEEVGLAVEVAADGLTALEKAQQHRYALILLDLQMPRLNGLDTARAIRKDSLNRDTPILAMTANAFEEDRQACLEAGMNDHIPKPIDTAVLYAAVLRNLEREA